MTCAFICDSVRIIAAFSCWDVFRDEVEKIEIKDLWIIGQNLKHYFAAMSYAHLCVKARCTVCGLRGVVGAELGAEQAGAESNSLGQNLEVHNRGLTVRHLLGWREHFITMKEEHVQSL